MILLLSSCLAYWEQIVGTHKAFWTLLTFSTPFIPSHLLYNPQDFWIKDETRGWRRGSLKYWWGLFLVFPNWQKSGDFNVRGVTVYYIENTQIGIPSSKDRGDAHENDRGGKLQVQVFRLEWQHCDWLRSLHQNPAEYFISRCITPHVSVCLCTVSVRMQTPSTVLMFSCFVECLSSLFKGGKLRNHRIKSFQYGFAISIQLVSLRALLAGSHLVVRFVPAKAN